MFNWDNLKMKNGVYYDIQKKSIQIPNLGLKIYGINSINKDSLDYHCGYIFLNIKKEYPGLVEVFEKYEEITCNTLIELGNQKYKVIGFDTAHAKNMLDPDTQTYNAVENTIYKILEEWKNV